MASAETTLRDIEATCEHWIQLAQLKQNKYLRDYQIQASCAKEILSILEQPQTTKERLLQIASHIEDGYIESRNDANYLADEIRKVASICT